MLTAPAVHEVDLDGRDAERAATGRLLAEAADGRGGALVFVGHPGEGRSALLSAAAGQAHGWLVLEVAGHADEGDLIHGGLQRLLSPVAGPAAELPPDQRDPIAALIAGRDPGVGPLPLCLATTALLRRAARDRPVLCLLDDAELLDAPSRQLIRLTARRLGGCRVAFLAAVAATASGSAFAAGLPSRRLAPLDEQAARSLLRRRAADLADEVVAGLLELAGGNPAALTELAGRLTPGQRRGYAALPVTLPPESRLGRRLRGWLDALPRRTRDLLVLAAAEPDARPGELLAAARRTGGPAAMADFEPAEYAGLVTVDATGVRFAPAVLRSVAYHEEPIGRRQAAHLALSEVLAARGRRLPALLHRAAVAAGPDEALAAELLAAAEAAGPAEAATAQRYAAELSATPAGTTAALLAAARSSASAGRPHDAAVLLRRAGTAHGGATVRARARGLIAELQLRSAPAEAQEVLLDVAAELLPADPAGALEALLLAGDACGRTGEPGRYPALARQAALECRDADQVPGMALHQVLGIADLITGADEAGFGHLREVLRLAERAADPAALIRAANMGLLLGQDRRAARLAHRAAAVARAGGATGLVPAALEVAAFAELAAGRYDAATTAALDGAALASGDLADSHLALLGLLAALVGDEETGRERVAAANARRSGGQVRALGDWTEALLDLVAGRPAAARERLAAIVAGNESMILRVAVVPHLVEAGAPAEAAAVFDRWAGHTGQNGWLALRARCRALGTPDGDAAEDHFREALACHRRDDEAGFAAAHTRLLYGRHLRRRRRPAEARAHLRRAVETFHRLDAGPWAEQAVRELRAAGERVTPAARTPLTAQQERIAGLVAEGATNREVARQLHLSPRTIDHHLRNVFARLGVRSRTELARLLAAG